MLLCFKYFCYYINLIIFLVRFLVDLIVRKEQFLIVFRFRAVYKSIEGQNKRSLDY